MIQNDLEMTQTDQRGLKEIKVIKKVKCDRPTNRPTNRPTDKAGCRVACTRLKRRPRHLQLLFSWLTSNLLRSQKFLCHLANLDVGKGILDTQTFLDCDSYWMNISYYPLHFPPTKKGCQCRSNLHPPKTLREKLD